MTDLATTLATSASELTSPRGEARIIAGMEPDKQPTNQSIAVYEHALGAVTQNFQPYVTFYDPRFRHEPEMLRRIADITTDAQGSRRIFTRGINSLREVISFDGMPTNKLSETVGQFEQRVSREMDGVVPEYVTVVYPTELDQPLDKTGAPQMSLPDKLRTFYVRYDLPVSAFFADANLAANERVVEKGEFGQQFRNGLQVQTPRLMGYDHVAFATERLAASARKDIEARVSALGGRESVRGRYALIDNADGALPISVLPIIPVSWTRNNDASIESIAKFSNDYAKHIGIESIVPEGGVGIARTVESIDNSPGLELTLPQPIATKQSDYTLGA